MFDILKKKKEKEEYRKQRKINVRFPSRRGDENRTMTIQEIQEEYKDYLIIDPAAGEQVDLKKLANLDNIQEVVVMPPIAGG